MSRVLRTFRKQAGLVLAAVTALGLTLHAPAALGGPKHHYGYSSGSVVVPAVGGYTPPGRPAGRSYNPSRHGYKLHRRHGARHHARHGYRHPGRHKGRHNVRHHRHGPYAHGSAVIPQFHNGSGVVLGGTHLRPSGHSHRYRRYHPGYHARFIGGAHGALPVYYPLTVTYGSGSVNGDVAIVVGSQATSGGGYAGPGETYVEQACQAGEYCSIRLGGGPDAPKIITFNDSGKPIN